jgi:hypothetical protein
MDWRCSSNGRASALEEQSPEFKPQSHKKTKQNNKKKLLSVTLEINGLRNLGGNFLSSPI